MRAAAFLGTAILAVTCSAAAGAVPPTPPKLDNGRFPILVLTNVTVIDATGAPAQPKMTVIIKGNRITALGRTARVHAPKGAQVVNAAGKFLIPGLWDMHVHFTEIERSFPLFMANGVTGVRNMGGELEDLLRWRAEVASGKVLGPRVLTCGPIVDGPQPAAHGPTVVVGTATQGRPTVDTLKQRGADCVKVYDRLSRDVYLASIDQAKKDGLPVVGHVPESLTTKEASDAGQKSIEHLGSTLQGCSTIEDELRRLEAAPMPSGGDFSEFPRRIAARGERTLDTVPRLYNVLEIARDFGSIRVHTREQREPDGAWDGWHEWEQLEGEGRVAHYDIRW